MSGMEFGPIPTVDVVVEAVKSLEQRINQRHAVFYAWTATLRLLPLNTKCPCP